ncbi:MAG: phosphodiester glycosidase family protein [Solirubrobacteraceae bacterium]
MLVAQQGRSRRARRARIPAWRVRRIAAIAAALALLPGIVSYLSMLTQRSDSSLGVRTVEWLKENGGRGLVNSIENWYYTTIGAPSTGGPGIHKLPTQPGAAVSPAALKALHKLVTPYVPPSIPSVMKPALPGEGVWHATFSAGGTQPPVLITSFRPDPNYPRNVAGIAWIDHTRTSTFLYPGIQEPSVTLPSRGPEEVPMPLRPRLVATFNSGFKLVDAGGGFAVGGHTYAPLKNGLATIVRYRNGNVDVQAWTGGPDVASNVLFARQNLPLIVNGGKPNPNLSDGPAWGATLGNAVRVWRSSVGVDRHGNLMYGAADAQTVSSLAAIMIRAGAVRAMELDINSYWPSFITYRHPGAAGAANLLPGMTRSTQRYLTPDDRDFFAVYVR